MCYCVRIKKNYCFDHCKTLANSIAVAHAVLEPKIAIHVCVAILKWYCSRQCRRQDFVTGGGK